MAEMKKQKEKKINCIWDCDSIYFYIDFDRVFFVFLKINFLFTRENLKITNANKKQIKQKLYYPFKLLVANKVEYWQ